MEGAFLPSARARHVRVVVVWSPHARFRVNYFVTRSRDEKRKEKREKNLCLWHLGKKKKEFFCLVSFINATEARARATQTQTHTHTQRERERERVVFVAYVSYQVVGVDNLYLKHGGTFVCNCCTITAVFVVQV